jgi:hypothetical protein
MTTQRKMTTAEYLALTDDYSSSIKVALAATGTEDDAGTAAHFASHVRDTVTAFAATDEAQLTADLIDAAIATVQAWELESTLSNRFSQFNSAVSTHLGEDINTWLTDHAGGSRVSHYWKRGGNTALLAAHCFPPQTVLRTVAVTGSGTSTQVAGSAVSTTLYGGAQVALKVTHETVGAANIVATITGLDSTGTSRTWTATIPSGSIVGTVVNCAGTGVTDGVSASAVTFTGGTAGDDFTVVTVEDRVIT